MNNSKNAFSISISISPEDMEKVIELMEILDKGRSSVFQQGLHELYAKVAEQAITGANNGHQPA